MKKKFLSLMLAMTMVLGLAACGGQEESTGDTSGETADNTASEAPAEGTASEAPAEGTAFKLGGTGPLTGGAAIYGNAAYRGAQIAVDEINAEGGAIQFDLRYEDDQHDAEKAVNAYNILKDWGMQISLGSVTSKPCEATAAETYADRIFALTPSASSTATTEGKDNMFQMCFMDPNQGSASALYISERAWAARSPSSGRTMMCTPRASTTPSWTRPPLWVWRLSPTPLSPTATTPTSPSSSLTPRTTAPIWCSCPCTISPLP